MALTAHKEAPRRHDMRHRLRLWRARSIARTLNTHSMHLIVAAGQFLSCVADEERAPAKPTFLEPMELQRKGCRKGDECLKIGATDEQIEACALARTTRYAKEGPGCITITTEFWECVLDVVDSKGCAAWTWADPDFDACFDAHFVNAPAPCLP